jgi:PLP dependent protein
MPEPVDAIRERYLRTLNAIANSARRAGRPPESVRLVVVTKTQPVAIIEAALQAGARILGENYAEEAVPKIEGLATSRADAATIIPGVEWHMIGHVQSRKARLVAQHFSLVHSLDSVRLARRLDQAAGALDRDLPVLLEFNVGGEVGKQGWLAADESAWPGLLPEVEAISGLSRLRVRGLMTMPPLSADPDAARLWFRRLRRLRDFMAAKVPRVSWDELSMGTSADFPLAVEEGATLVRIGQAILGSRPVPEAT